MGVTKAAVSELWSKSGRSCSRRERRVGVPGGRAGDRAEGAEGWPSAESQEVGV